MPQRRWHGAFRRKQASLPTAFWSRSKAIPSLCRPSWSLEVTNAILIGERKKRLNQLDIGTFTTLLVSLRIVQDTQPVMENIRSVLPPDRAHGLSAYDAAYLELSLRHSAPLATVDAKLRKAANEAGIKLFVGETAR